MPQRAEKMERILGAALKDRMASFMAAWLLAICARQKGRR
jgi:hypothetical protein